MKKIVSILMLSSIIISCGDYRIHCDSDPSSVRIVSRKNPFIPIAKSIKSSINVATTYLTDISAKLDKDRERNIKENITELSNTSYLQLQLVKGYYEAFRTRPCDENTYKDYIINLEKYRQYLIEINKLNSDLTKMVNSSGITGNNISVISDRVAKYLATRHE